MDKITKALEKLERRERDKVELAIARILLRQLAEYDVKKVQGLKNLYRIRIGRHRIIFFMTKERVIVVDVTKRDENTYKNL